VNSRTGFLTSLVCLGACVACTGEAGSSADSHSQPTGAVAVKAVYSMMRESAGHGSEAPGPRTILQALPGSDLSRQMGRAFSDAVVMGTVTAVEEGQAYRVVGATDSPVPWEANDIDVLSTHVTLDVHEPLCATKPVPSSVTFRFFITSKNEITTVREGLTEMGEIAVFLKSSPDPEDPIYYQADASGLLSEVDGDGRIPWPVARQHYGSIWAEGGDTVASLKHGCTV